MNLTLFVFDVTVVSVIMWCCSRI